MLLRIFVKRKAHGELVETDFQYNNWMFEGDEILVKDNIQEKSENGSSGFHDPVSKTFTVKKNGQVVNTKDFWPNNSGYEILNDAGVVVERYVTTIN